MEATNIQINPLYTSGRRDRRSWPSINMSPLRDDSAWGEGSGDGKKFALLSFSPGRLALTSPDGRGRMTGGFDHGDEHGSNTNR